MPAGSLRVSGTVEEQRQKLVSTQLCLLLCNGHLKRQRFILYFPLMCFIVSLLPVYENTDLASRFLLSDAPFSLRGYIQHCNDTVWPLFSHLESAVREGANQRDKAFGETSKDAFQVIQPQMDQILRGKHLKIFYTCHLFLFKVLQQSRSQTEIHERHAQHR